MNNAMYSRSRSAVFRISLMIFCIFLIILMLVSTTLAWFTAGRWQTVFSTGKIALQSDVDNNIFFSTFSSFPIRRQLSFEPIPDEFGDLQYYHAETIRFSVYPENEGGERYYTSGKFGIAQDTCYVIPVVFFREVEGAQVVIGTLTDNVEFNLVNDETELEALNLSEAEIDNVIKNYSNFILQKTNGYIKAAGDIGSLAVVRVTATDVQEPYSVTTAYIIFEAIEFTDRASLKTDEQLLRHDLLEISNVSTASMKLRVGVTWRFDGDNVLDMTDDSNVRKVCSVDELLKEAGLKDFPFKRKFMAQDLEMINPSASPLTFNFITEDEKSWFPIDESEVDGFIIIHDLLQDIFWRVNELNITSSQKSQIIAALKNDDDSIIDMFLINGKLNTTFINSATAYFYYGDDSGNYNSGDYGVILSPEVEKIPVLDYVKIGSNCLEFSVSNTIILTFTFQARQARYYYGFASGDKDDWWHTTLELSTTIP